MNREVLLRVVLWQLALVGGCALLVWISTQRDEVAQSLLAGGACVAVPNTVYAFWLAAWQRSGRSKDHPAAVLGGEFLKMLVACIGFVLVAKFFAGVVWPAMISGIIAAVLSSLFLFFFYKY